MATPTLAPRKTAPPTKPKKDAGIQIAPELTGDPKIDRVLWDLASKIEGVGGEGWATGKMQENPLVFDSGLRMEQTRPTSLSPLKWHLYDKSNRTRGKGAEIWLNNLRLFNTAGELAAAPLAAIDHGSIAGLGDLADHTWAALVNGSRPITGLQDFDASLRIRAAGAGNYATLARGADVAKTITLPADTSQLPGLELANAFTAAQSVIAPSGIAFTAGTTNTEKDLVIGEIPGATTYVGIGMHGSLALSGTYQANFFSSQTNSILYINNVNHIALRINNEDSVLLTSSRHLLIYDRNKLEFGTSEDAVLQWNTFQTPDSLMLGLGADSNGLIITTKANVGATDFAHVLETNPTLFLHDASLVTTNFTKWSHGLMEAAAGNLSFTAKGGHVRIRSGTNVNYTSLEQASDVAASAVFPASAITVAAKELDNAFTAFQTFEGRLRFASETTAFYVSLTTSCTANRIYTFADESMTIAGRDVSNTFTVDQQFGSATNQSSAAIAARVAGNSLEFGHGNTAGYGSTLGATGGGTPFLAFFGEVEPGLNTFRTRGWLGSVMYADGAGGFKWGDLPVAIGTGQTVDVYATLSNAGTLGLYGDLALAATKRIYLDGVGAGGDSYISETAANIVEHFAGSVSAIKLKSTGLTAKGGILVPFTFYDPNISGTATDEVVPTEAGGVNYEYVLPFAGSIVAISVALNAAGTGGTLTYKPTINGVAAAAPYGVISGAELGQYDYTTAVIGANTFLAGDRLGCTLTSLAFTPTTADAQIMILVEFNTGAIA